MAGSKAANTNESVHVGVLILLVPLVVRVCVLSGYLCLCAGVLINACTVKIPSQFSTNLEFMAADRFFFWVL